MSSEVKVNPRDYDPYQSIPEDFDPRIDMAKWAYNIVKIAINEWMFTLNRQIKDTSHDSRDKFESNILTARNLISMIKEAEESFRMADNWEAMKQFIVKVRAKVEMMENTGFKVALTKELDDAEKKVDKALEVK
jgi:hypothetical protein